MLQCLDLTCSLQVIFVPFLSSFLKWRDTTILMLAVSFIITGFFLTAFSSQLWVLYVCYCLFMLWNTVTTTCRFYEILSPSPLQTERKREKVCQRECVCV